MKKTLRNILFGNIPVTEYSTITVKGDIQERVCLQTGNERMDVSTTHWLLCLDPVVFGIWFQKKEQAVFFNSGKKYKMCFTGSGNAGEPVAVLDLVFFNKIEEPDGILLLLKLEAAAIHHLNLIRTRLLFYKYYKKPEQDFYRLKSYAAAYSYPRRVRVVSFKEGDAYNIFPMDLVGDIPQSNRYVLGLRHTNVTLARIIVTKKLAISEVPCQYKDTIYQLGKHHRGPMSSPGFNLIPSKNFGFPIPEWANSYKELRINSTINLGSHMLLWAEEIGQKTLREPDGHLFHIHFLHYLGQYKKGLAYPLV